MSYPYTLPANDPARKGMPAGPRQIFGPFSEIGIQPVHIRFEGPLAWAHREACRLCDKYEDAWGEQPEPDAEQIAVQRAWTAS